MMRRLRSATFKAILLLLLVLPGTLLLYARTAAPSVLSGDSAEFQFAAPLLAVPHPTGYPLYILLGRLATLLPIGDVAHRVTLVSVVAGAGTVSLLGLLLLRVTGSLPAALVGAATLAVAPGLWHLSTIAEVYTLNTLLLLLLALLLWQAHARNTAADDQPPPALPQPAWLSAAACVTGLGISHHGSFAFTGMPLFLAFGVLPLYLRMNRRSPVPNRRRAAHLLRLCLFGLLGLTPWLFVLIQYARFGPFAGTDHGLPHFYFWGAPQSWQEAMLHVTGGSLRGGVFDLPGPGHLYQTALVLWERLQFEFGPLGVSLGVLGCYTLLRRPPWLWLASAWVAGVTAFYFASLGPGVQDAMVFTLPLLLPWAFWIGVGAVALADRVDRLLAAPAQPTTGKYLQAFVRLRHSFSYGIPAAVPGLCLLLTLVWGQTRLPYGNKADQWLFRTFGEGALTQMESNAVVLTRWEQGTILQYLRLVEGLRPDVRVDILEPEDESWQAQARRYADRPLYLIGGPADGAALEAEYAWGTDYATLYAVPGLHGEQ